MQICPHKATFAYMDITTDIFAIAPQTYVRLLLMRLLRRRWWTIAIPALAAIIAAIVAADIRYLLVTFVLVLLVLPHVLVCQYYFHAMSPQAARCVIPHRVRFADDRLTITYALPDDSDDKRPAPADEEIRYNTITETRMSADHIEIMADGTLTAIPLAAFGQRSDALAAIQSINTR